MADENGPVRSLIYALVKVEANSGCFPDTQVLL
jgi:hypothetical protein